MIGAPNGDRTRVSAVKGRRPGPLDDGRGCRKKPVRPDGRDAIRSAVRTGKGREGRDVGARGACAAQGGGTKIVDHGSPSKIGEAMRAIRIRQTGGPEVMRLEEVELPPPGKGQVRLRQHAIGINYMDVYQRTGFYPTASLPFTPGGEGAGEVVEVGPSVEGFKPGDRVAYAGPAGAYADERNIEARFLFKLPRAISYETGAAMMLKGLTAQYLLRQTYRVN